MAITLGNIRPTIRGLVVDLEEGGIVNAFSDANIDSAVNFAVGDYFGRRPEAFSVSGVVVDPPSDYTNDADVIGINPWAEKQFVFGVAAFLLRQRGKDSYYRKAADALYEVYIKE